jgi:hypothetical protein
MERKEFREVLATLLADELGVFESGMPAIWTDAGDTPTMRSGLLCLVERQRNPVSHRAILNYQAEQNFDWIAPVLVCQPSIVLAARFANGSRIIGRGRCRM